MNKKFIAILACIMLLSFIIPVSGTPPYPPSNPNPSNGATGVEIDVDPSWTGGDPDGDPVTYDVYFGTVSPPPGVTSNQTNNFYSPGLLDVNTKYYWRIGVWDNNSEFTLGPIWNFTTRPNTFPDQASNPGPANNSVDIDIYADLNWTGGDPDLYDSIYYNVFFGTSTNPPNIETVYLFNTYDLGRLQYNTQYYWRIDTWDSYGAETDGPEWTFTTRDDNPPNTPSNPEPINNSINISLFTDLNWTGGDPDPNDPVTYDVYFGTNNPPPRIIINQSSTTYNPGAINPGATYYWRIVAWDAYGYSSSGPIWTFTTRDDNPPYIPSNPNPADNSTDILIDSDLSWTGGDPDNGDSVTYDVFFGTNSNPPLVSSAQTSTTYDPGILDYDTRYYWRIISIDSYSNSTLGPIWNFRTEVYANDPPNRPSAPDGPPFGHYQKSQTFTTSTTDPEGDLLYYRFDWDDGTLSKWVGPYESGQTAAASHTWLFQGTYAIKVQARDEHYAVSVWSDPYSITMPKNKVLSNTFILQLLEILIERFPLLEKILLLTPFFSNILNIE